MLKKTLKDGASNDRLSGQSGPEVGKRRGDSIEHLYRRDRKSARPKFLSGQ